MTKIGPYTAYAIESGQFRLDGGAMFGVIPKVLWGRRIEADARNRITLNMRCLLLEGAGRLILVDVGVGDKYDARFADMFAIDHSEFSLERGLRASGFAAEDITDVVLTHLHFDHAGGATVRMGDMLMPRFPNATYYVQRDHLRSARAPSERERASFLPENIDRLAASGQLQRIEGAGTLFPGIDIIVVHGHTEAQQLLKISGPEGTLVYVADLLPTVHHVRGPWIMAYDVRPLVTLAEKTCFLDEAVSGDYRLFFEHDPDVAIANVIGGERGITTDSPRTLEELF